jgi:hypothetical protein
MAKEIKNPFKELEQTLQEAPPHLKKKVMSDVAAAKLLMEMASLFTFNYMAAVEGIFMTKTRSN